MERLRKILEATFAMLSIAFALIALIKYFSSKKTTESEHSEYSSDAPAQWGQNMLAQARRESKLIIFRVEDSAKNRSAPLADLLGRHSKNLQKILSDNYICVYLDSRRWPADFLVLDTILASQTNRSTELKTGILSPRMKPIFLSSRIESDSHSHSDSDRIPLSTLIAAAAKEYKSNKSTVVKEAQSSVRLIYRPEDFKPAKIEAPYIPRLSFINAESMSLLSFFANPSSYSAPPAILSENARLAIRIAATDLRQRAAQQAAALAVQNLAARLERNSIGFTERLMYMRAIAEYALIKKDARLIEKLAAFANELIADQNESGVITNKGESPTVAQNALAISYLAWINTLTGNPAYIKAAEKSASALASILKNYEDLPAVLEGRRDSQASSHDYAMLAHAFCDMHYATGDKKYLALASDTVDTWSKSFMTTSGLWSINSQNSVLSDYARPIITNDSILPSYIGTAAQIYSYLRKNDPSFAPLNADKISRVASSAFTSSPFLCHTNASYKLAFFTFKDGGSAAGAPMPRHYMNSIRDAQPDGTDSDSQEEFKRSEPVSVSSPSAKDFSIEIYFDTNRYGNSPVSRL